MSLIKVTPDQVIELGKVTADQRTKLIELTNAIEGKVASTDWESPAATRFKEDWAAHKANLVKLEQALESVANAATKMGQNYADADNSYGKA